MTAELVRGQNHPLPDTRLEIRVSAGHPVVAGAALGDERGRVPGVEWIAHPVAPSLPGVDVPRQVAADQRLAVDLAAVPDAVHRVSVLLALPVGAGGPTSFGKAAAPFVAVTGPDGTEIASYTITGLDSESAVVALELYRRQGAWKVRAMGQGYEGGLAALLGDQGLERPADLAASILAPAQAPASTPTPTEAPAPASEPTPAVPGPAQTPGGPISYTHPRRRTTTPEPAPTPAPAPQAAQASQGTAPVPVAGDAAGWSMDERLYNQVWGMFEDLARTAAAYRSACEFAESRLDRELDETLSDYRSRVGGANDAARSAARARHDELVERAREVLDRDLAQLAVESEVVEPALPPAYARWDNPAWHAYRPPAEEPMAVRLGDLHLPERTELRIPMLVRLPLERGLWVDSGRGRSEAAGLLDETELRRLALDSAVAHAARLLAVHPPGGFAVHVVDAAGAGAAALAPLVDTGVLAAPPARGAAGVTAVLDQLTERVDLLQMALRNGAVDALPPGLDEARQLLIVHDFPHGFDDRAVTRLRYLADEGPGVGVHLLIVADREDAAAYGPVLDPLWRSLLRLTPVPDDHLADPWVGHAWSYEPPLLPPGSRILRQVLAQVAEARPAKQP
ncbi:Putative export associated protein [Streptomyces venezuelae]|uniref:TerD family protein n=1 Tax=Streptomyces gardneri TaxID=66892 RepID=UPI000716B953|nr:TerD family protein [Streptomyces gardneri]ALO07584.1 Putative export associated protein [Streptomyces venezuelae]QPK44897.1 TerD family protein [Streptomyces gardneri]WRK36210.1 TerD family protein [Streptomyces venezuelae]